VLKVINAYICTYIELLDTQLAMGPATGKPCSSSTATKAVNCDTTLLSMLRAIHSSLCFSGPTSLDKSLSGKLRCFLCVWLVVKHQIKIIQIYELYLRCHSIDIGAQRPSVNSLSISFITPDSYETLMVPGKTCSVFHSEKLVVHGM